MHPSLAISLLTTALLSTSSLARNIPRQTLPYIPVLTEPSTPKYSRKYPDAIADILHTLYGSTPVNTTCWLLTTMWDSKGLEDGNPLYLKLAAPYSGYISENSLQARDIDFQSSLPECPESKTIYHAVHFVDTKYWTETVSGPGAYAHPCFETPSLGSRSFEWRDVGYESIGCYVLGGEVVEGNSTWVKNRDEKPGGGVCYVPAGWGSPEDTHGVAPVC